MKINSGNMCEKKTILSFEKNILLILLNVEQVKRSVTVHSHYFFFNIVIPFIPFDYSYLVVNGK